MKHRTNTALQTVLIMADLILLWTALFCASQLREVLPMGKQLSIADALKYEWELYLSVAGVWLGVTLAFSTYRSSSNRLAYQELGDLLKAVLFSTVLLAGLLYLTTRDVSRLRFWYFIALAFPLLMLFRLALRTAYRLLYHRSWGSAMMVPSRVVVVGEGSILYDTICTLSGCDPKEVALLGYIDCQADLEQAMSEAAGNGLDAGLAVQLGGSSNGHYHNEARVGEEARQQELETRAPALTVLEPVHTAASMRAAARISGNLAGIDPDGDFAVPQASEAQADSQSEERTAFGLSPLGAMIEKLVVSRRADNVVVAMSRKHHYLLSRVVAELQKLPVHIVLMPDVADLTILNVGVTELGNAPALKLRAPILTDMQLAMKRVMDIAIVGVMLPFLLPLMALVALAIKLDSPGPIVFKQKRVGQYGKHFTIFKFRTMVQNAEQRLREVTTFTEDGKPLFKNDKGDPRITRVGKILRRLSLDELPQLFNVLRGHMSLVGPRPELPTYVGYYDTWQHFRLWVPPGITGWWQVKGREKQPMYLYWDDDLYYIRNYSLLLDLQILWITLSSAVLGSTGR